MHDATDPLPLARDQLRRAIEDATLQRDVLMISQAADQRAQDALQAARDRVERLEREASEPDDDRVVVRIGAMGEALTEAQLKAIATGKLRLPWKPFRRAR